MAAHHTDFSFETLFTDGSLQQPDIKLTPYKESIIPETTSSDHTNNNNNNIDGKNCCLCAQPFKYRCPACERRVCSLACSKQHKKEFNCTGLRSSNKFIPLTNFSDTDIRSDFDFLMDAMRVAETAKKQNFFKKKQFTDFSDTFPQQRKHHPLVDTLIYQAKHRNIKLLIMPSGMSKRKHNTTKYVKQSKTIMWRVEWIFTDVEGKITTEQLDEHTTLETALEKVFAEPNTLHSLREYINIGIPKLVLLIKNERSLVGDLIDGIVTHKASNPEFYELDTKSTLSSALAWKEVIEYPTIYVALPHNKSKFTIVSSPDKDNNTVFTQREQKRRKYTHPTEDNNATEDTEAEHVEEPVAEENEVDENSAEIQEALTALLSNGRNIEEILDSVAQDAINREKFLKEQGSDQ